MVAVEYPIASYCQTHPTLCVQDGPEDRRGQQASVYNGVGVTGLIAGGVFAVGDIVWLVLTRPPSAPPSRRSVSRFNLRPTLTGAVATWEF
ncbi:MAG: hypothetical protein WCJ30_18770 [Deltaproteobacteria bacterium]